MKALSPKAHTVHSKSQTFKASSRSFSQISRSSSLESHLCLQCPSSSSFHCFHLRKPKSLLHFPFPTRDRKRERRDEMRERLNSDHCWPSPVSVAVHLRCASSRLRGYLSPAVLLPFFSLSFESIYDLCFPLVLI